MGGGELVLIVALAAGGSIALERVGIVGGLALVDVAGRRGGPEVRRSASCKYGLENGSYHFGNTLFHHYRKFTYFGGKGQKTE